MFRYLKESQIFSLRVGFPCYYYMLTTLGKLHQGNYLSKRCDM